MQVNNITELRTLVKINSLVERVPSEPFRLLRGCYIKEDKSSMLLLITLKNLVSWHSCYTVKIFNPTQVVWMKILLANSNVCLPNRIVRNAKLQLSLLIQH
jgi:hypothetical protein